METNTSTEKIVQLFKEAMDALGWQYQRRLEGDAFTITKPIAGMICQIKGVVSAKGDVFVAAAAIQIPSEHTDKKTMDALSEFANRISFGMRLGCFVLDYETKEILFKYGLCCKSEMPPLKVTQDALLLPFAMMREYEASICGIIFGGMSAEEALALSEIL